ncbi:XVIPCD domain-containing protein [Xanthomonas graminis]|uniref:X-Tfes XVIPCD domain-containing protein n=1 Tax=Xanthomonas graminis pv. phlei TaxID=487906 RepID=A0A0K2ZEX3_9XANT|nr:XVIPCD domain-containing protein [Xanthomonas translucens]CTP84266.1 hypothetical protein XTPLMG730_0728 [Xanthomonas translucens pv. phlei]
MSSQTRAKFGLGPLSLDLGGQRNSGENVRATQADGSSSVASKLQYADNVPLTLTRQFDAAGSEHVAARRYQLGFGKVDANQAQLLNTALARKDSADDAIVAGQDLTLNFSEAQMGALRQRYAQAAQARPFDREQAGAYARMSNEAFALDLARTLCNSPYGLSKRLFHVAARTAPASAPSDPCDPAHPDHAMQRMIDARLTPADPQLATHLLLAARREGLTRVDHVLRNDTGRVFAVQGDPMSADKRTAYVDAQVATATSLQDSVRQLNALNATAQQSAVAAAQETPDAAQRAPAR